MTGHSRLALAIGVLVLAPGVARGDGDDKAAAEALFMRAKELATAGRTVEACPLYAASYRTDPQLGALLNLANCHEVIGRTASAWAEFREAAELATRRGDSRIEYARRRASALEPRLVRLRIVAAAVPGLAVRRGDVEITDVLGEELVVDPGVYVVTATAPHRETWTSSVDATADGQHAEISIPTLGAVTVTPPQTSPPLEPLDHTTPAPRPAPTQRSARAVWAFAIGGVGIGVAATGLAFGVHAYREWNASRDPAACDASNVCNTSGSDHIAAARSSARTSTYLITGGSALVLGAAIVWWSAPRRGERAPVRTITPATDGRSAMLRYVTTF